MSSARAMGRRQHERLDSKDRAAARTVLVGAAVPAGGVTGGTAWWGRTPRVRGADRQYGG